MAQNQEGGGNMIELLITTQYKTKVWRMSNEELIAEYKNAFLENYIASDDPKTKAVLAFVEREIKHRLQQEVECKY